MHVKKRGADRRVFLFFFSLVIISLFLPVLVLAHEEEEAKSVTEHTGGTEEPAQAPLFSVAQVESLFVKIVLSATIIIILFVVYALLLQKELEKDTARLNRIKAVLFLGIAIPAVLSTLALAAGTIYLNTISATSGPVHWHADYEIWNCGKKMDLVAPTGIMNRVGTSVFHEHNDNRIHVEGVVLDPHDAALGHFFEVVGGALNDDYARVPTDHGIVTLRNGENCNSMPGVLQAFRYRVVNPDDAKQWRYVQEKIDEPKNYILAPYGYVPPGDCIIIEFDLPKEKTDKVCASYPAAENRGELSPASATTDIEGSDA